MCWLFFGKSLAPFKDVNWELWIRNSKKGWIDEYST